MAVPVTSKHAARSGGQSANGMRRVMALAGVALALGGCGSSPPKDPLADVVWSYATDSVLFEIAADPGLNQFDG